MFFNIGDIYIVSSYFINIRDFYYLSQYFNSLGDYYSSIDISYTYSGS